MFKFAGATAAFFCSLLLITALPTSTAAQSDKSRDKSADVVLSLSKFGVSIFNTAAAGYNESVAKDPSFLKDDPKSVQDDIKALSEKYRSEMRTASATADLTQSIGDVVITSAVAFGITTGVGAIPIALYGAAANWGNEKFATMIRTEDEHRAEAFLYTSLQRWDEKKGVSYEKVRQLLKDGKGDEASIAFDQATGMLTRLREELKDDEKGKQVAETFLFNTIQAAERSTIEQVGKNTKTIKSVEADLAAISSLLDSLRGTPSLAWMRMGSSLAM